MALHNFNVGCNSVMDGKEGGCTKQCKSALISLLSTEDKQGFAFINCDCQGNKHCMAPKSRVEVCAKDVLSAMESIDDDKTQLSCELAQWICEADTTCFTAWNYYRGHCSEFFLGTPNHCSPRCNNSLTILYRQPRAKKLRNCRCDDPATGSICQKIKDNTERLCFNKYPLQRPASDQPGEPLETKDQGYNYEQKNQSQYNTAMLPTYSVLSVLVTFAMCLLLCRSPLQ